MEAGPKRAGAVAAVGSREGDPQPVGVQAVGDGQLERPRPTRLRAQHQPHGGVVGPGIGNRPGRPPHQAVDGVVLVRLAQSRLFVDGAKVVGPVLEPVGPGDEGLAPAGRTPGVLGVAVEDLHVAGAVPADAAADLHDHRSLLSPGEHRLTSGRSGQHARTL